MTIKSPDGTTYDTEEVSQRWDLFFCSECGSRMGWYEVGMHDEPVCTCEDCVARITNESDEE